MIKVSPGAAKTKVLGMMGEIVKISIHAAPERGKANKELVTFLAACLNISKNDIEIVQGETSPLKRVAIKNYSRQQILDLLTATKN